MADSRDITGKNRKFTGTDSIQLPVGSTGQRNASGSSDKGKIRFNNTTNLSEYYDGTDWKAIDAPPVVSTISVAGRAAHASDSYINRTGVVDSTLETIVINGSLFDTTGATVTFEGTAGSAGTVTTQSITRNSASQLTVTVTSADFVQADEPYNVKVLNGSGLSGVLASALVVNDPPTFDTAAGSLGTVFDGNTVSGSTLDASATDADGDTITYSVTTGSLPAGLSIGSSTGLITGTPSATGTETFTVTAATSKGNATRQFSITVNSLPSGGTITTFNTNFKIHAFTSDGTFVNNIAGLSYDTLLVAGGGGGGSGQTVCTNNHHCGGGGGAGGLVYKSSQTLTSGNKSIVIGQGGQGARSEIDNAGAKGTDTTAFGFTALGGGGGETRNAQNACGLNPATSMDGGSGGGRSNTSGRAGNATQPGSTDGGFGNAGGVGVSVAGGGGGGAGAAGQDANDGDGGAGKQYSTEFGTTYGADSGYFAGGGGGGDAGTGNDGEGGTGGGGDGVSNETSPGGNGTDGTGGGGGGGAGETPGSNDGRGGDGGNGIVLVKYDVSNI